MTLYVHGRVTVTNEDHEEYVVLTTPIAVDGALVQQFADSSDAANVDDDVRLYRLVEVGALRDGIQLTEEQ